MLLRNYCLLFIGISTFNGSNADFSDLLSTFKDSVLDLITDRGRIANDIFKKMFDKFYVNMNSNESDNNNITIKYEIYTRENSADCIKINNETIKDLFYSTMSSKKPTKIIIHGWLDHCISDWVLELRDEYLKMGDYNIIVVDWDKVSSNAWYPGVVGHLQSIGDIIGEFLAELEEKNYIDFQTVHIIGHSLGAHIAGCIGKYLNGKIGRITGLDPAAPLIELYGNTTQRLDKNNAVFVDVIHTCTDYTGINISIGHVDVWPNGGFCRQPGCVIETSYSCGHFLAYKYMIESIKHPNRFLATRCENWENYKEGKCKNEETIFMGENTRSAHGSFFLQTQRDPPYGMSIVSYKVFLCD